MVCTNSYEENPRRNGVNKLLGHFVLTSFYLETPAWFKNPFARCLCSLSLASVITQHHVLHRKDRKCNKDFYKYVVFPNMNQKKFELYPDVTHFAAEIACQYCSIANDIENELD